jgi:hypothetical protein
MYKTARLEKRLTCFIICRKILKIALTIGIFIFMAGIDLSGQVYGCNDAPAINYNPAATTNDGSCIYEDVIADPVNSFVMSETVSETSGLIIWDGKIWTHNDSDDNNLYALDSLDGSIIVSYLLEGLLNTDWEEISQDDNYVYIGDTGNNMNGNRTDLKILRIGKNTILAGDPIADTIFFSYYGQSDFSPSGANNTDFDCEAFIVSSDSIYLFTKQWKGLKTAIYSIPKTPGSYTARFIEEYDIQGMITGSVFLEEKKLVVLCGYDDTLQPFFWLLYDFSGPFFFSGNKRKLFISLPFHQVEGITTSDGLKYYVSNEAYVMEPFIDIPPKLHIFDLKPFLEDYLASLISEVPVTEPTDFYKIYPVPSDQFLTVKSDPGSLPSSYEIINQLGQTVLTGIFTESDTVIDISRLSEGIYILNTGRTRKQSFKVIRR